MAYDEINNCIRFYNGTEWSVCVDGAGPVTITGDLTTTVVDVEAPVGSGLIWMDRNLGATQVATSSSDAASYGDLYQWGRGADGHQLRTSSTTTTNATTAEPSQGYNSWDGKFIFAGPASDWLVTNDDNLWQGVSGTNNPCPAGYRLPTEAEMQTLQISFTPQTYEGAYASPIKMPAGGRRQRDTGSIAKVETHSYYWASGVSTTNENAVVLVCRPDDFCGVGASSRATGFSVRCLKD
ncbi:MAG: hypothetical protein GY770_06920 [Aestuariibacter sp.]|nr:hypothetical protein [Aestuariibacter sp.]